jgi:hypothetical protein
MMGCGGGVGFIPRVQSCLLPTSSRSPKQTVQTLSNPLYSRTIEVGSDSGGDIGRGGLLNGETRAAKPFHKSITSVDIRVLLGIIDFGNDSICG